MKTNRSFKLILLLFLLIGMGSCKDKEERPALIGKWRLEKVQTVFYDPQVYDYSGDNIIYEFKRDGKLIVSSDIEDYQGLGTGEYPYKVSSNILTIGNSDCEYSISGSELTLDDSPLDGPISHFTRF